jgi:hypothetical protein
VRGKVGEIELSCNDPGDGDYYTLDKEEWSYTCDCVLSEVGGKLRRAEKGDELRGFKIKTPCLYVGVARSDSDSDHDDTEVEKEDDQSHIHIHYAIILGYAKDGSFVRVGLAKSRSHALLFKNTPEQDNRIV